ncbi:hypothetical protein LCGC14_0510760 [marine sediment metagenome]|uniref:Uncharacterized protein n=1 Tax=marine sediment metagenome TaxID=412755 RepID=A0A0F9S615_9ZZZZ
MNTIGYTPGSIADGRDGDPSAIWDNRISSIPDATRPRVDDLERKLFAGLGAPLSISRNIRGAPGWWISSEDGDTAHHVDLLDVLATPDGAFEARREIVAWANENAGSLPRVVVRFGDSGEIEIIATDGAEVFVVDERSPENRVCRMPCDFTLEGIELLIGDSTIMESSDYRLRR